MECYLKYLENMKEKKKGQLCFGPNWAQKLSFGLYKLHN